MLQTDEKIIKWETKTYLNEKDKYLAIIGFIIESFFDPILFWADISSDINLFFEFERRGLLWYSNILLSSFLLERYSNFFSGIIMQRKVFFK